MYYRTGGAKHQECASEEHFRDRRGYAEAHGGCGGRNFETERHNGKADAKRKMESALIYAKTDQGGTLTLSNIGTVGGTYMKPVLMVPESVIGAVAKCVYQGERRGRKREGERERERDS
jgi:hypothetical protein